MRLGYLNEKIHPTVLKIVADNFFIIITLYHNIVILGMKFLLVSITAIDV